MFLIPYLVTKFALPSAGKISIKPKKDELYIQTKFMTSSQNNFSIGA